MTIVAYIIFVILFVGFIFTAATLIAMWITFLDGRQLAGKRPLLGWLSPIPLLDWAEKKGMN